jgi:hypothetical protein
LFSFFKQILSYFTWQGFWKKWRFIWHHSQLSYPLWVH